MVNRDIPLAVSLERLTSDFAVRVAVTDSFPHAPRLLPHEKRQQGLYADQLRIS